MKLVLPADVQARVDVETAQPKAGFFKRRSKS